MTTLRTGVITCASPSCAARIELGVVLSPLAVMRRHHWALERQDDDPRPMPYCPRCRDTEPTGAPI